MCGTSTLVGEPPLAWFAVFRGISRELFFWEGLNNSVGIPGKKRGRVKKVIFYFGSSCYVLKFCC